MRSRGSFDGQVPDVPGVAAVVLQYRLLGGRGEQPVPGHANTLSDSTDISGGGEAAFPPRPEGRGLHAAILMTQPPESTARRYGKVFDEIAAEYDRHRPTYPGELVDQACRVAGIGSGDHVLEVGCGSGQLTRGLVARGLHVTALEPGKSLIALARQNLEGAGEVEFVNAQFEDALFPREQFQAVFSASAFHWVDPKVSWQKTADVLVPGGTLALVQYCGLEEPRSKRTLPLIGQPTGISTPRSLGWSNAVVTSQRYGPGSAATT